MSHVPKSLLHVDDDSQLSKIVARYLKSEGYKVTTVNDPTSVMDELIRSDIRVVLLDIDMPNMSGLELLEKIKQFDGGILVVMLTGVVTLQTVLASLQRGAEACFFKPVQEFDPLCEALDDCFRKIDRWWTTLDNLSRRRSDEAMPSLSTNG